MKIKTTEFTVTVKIDHETPQTTLFNLGQLTP